MNYYELLNCSQQSSPEQIQTEYRALALKYHPDRSAQLPGSDMFSLITKAKEVLSDSTQRCSYDKWLNSHIPFSFSEFRRRELEISSATHFSLAGGEGRMLSQLGSSSSWKRGEVSDKSTGVLAQFKQNKI